MIRCLLSHLRDRFSVGDPEDRIEGSGEAIVSPQHRRSASADRLLANTKDERGANEREHSERSPNE